MAVVGTRFHKGSQLTASMATYGTAPATNVRRLVEHCTVTNVTASPAWFDMHLVVSAGTAGSTNQLVDGKSVAPGETYIVSEIVGHWVEEGETIQAIASAAAALTIMISALDVS